MEKGQKHTEESKKKISEKRKNRPAWNKGLKGFRAGEKHHWYGRNVSYDKSPTWKGINVGYRGLHLWVQKILGTPNECSFCEKKGTGHNMHWANLSGEYKREKSDWIRLCPKCHCIFDKSRSGISKIENGL